MPEDLGVWIVNNTDLILTAWAAVIAVAEVAKRIIPGTKDDTLIVKVLDTAGKIGTLGAANFLPAQDGVKKAE
jgi:hypothetical protein